MVALGGGACVVAPRGMHSCLGGGVVAQGACVAALGGHAWLLQGACVVATRGACVVAPGGGGVHGIRRDTEIRSMSGRYASYWNAFLYCCENESGKRHRFQVGSYRIQQFIVHIMQRQRSKK